jgi:autotransporter-associated beta strand protein
MNPPASWQGCDCSPDSHFVVHRADAASLGRWNVLQLRTFGLLLTALAIIVGAARLHAGSATWGLKPTSNDWNTAANWTPETVPDAPTDIATFDVSNVTDVTVPGDIYSYIQLDSMVFNPGASTYDITFQGALEGTGVVNNSGVVQHLDSVSPGDFAFTGSATAGDGVVYTNNGETPPAGVGSVFNDRANAGSATFINEGDSPGLSPAALLFRDNSSAANSTIVNESGDTRGGLTGFSNSATAANSTIITHSGASLFLSDLSTGGSATLIADGGTISFSSQSNGESARIELLHGGIFSITAHKHNTVTLIGSLEGDRSGQVHLGQRQLSIGGNGLSTTFAGVIKDDNHHIGSLVKTGSETLTLTHANNYGGGTTITGGVLIAQNRTGSATGTGAVNVSAGTLGGKGIIAGLVTVGTGSGTGAVLAPSVGSNRLATLILQSALTFNADGAYSYRLNTRNGQADQVIANGVTIESGAQFDFQALGNRSLPLSTIFSVISNTGPSPISGTFANLPDGSTFTVGNNTFQVSYEGGDGNDLTLTVVP